MRHAPLALMLLLALHPVAAEECVPTTSTPDVCHHQPTRICAPGDVAGLYYVQLDECGDGACIFSFWIYEESNGIPGLQRQDEVHDDTCGGSIDGDTIVF